MIVNAVVSVVDPLAVVIAALSGGFLAVSIVTFDGGLLAVRHDGASVQFEFGLGPPVVEARFEDDVQLDAPIGALDLPVEGLLEPFVGRFTVSNGHEVGHGRRAVVGLEGGLEDVRLVDVGLARLELGGGTNGEAAALVRIEDRREDARRLDVREATPVDRAVSAHEGAAIVVADSAVVVDREER